METSLGPTKNARGQDLNVYHLELQKSVFPWQREGGERGVCISSGPEISEKQEA